MRKDSTMGRMTDADPFDLKASLDRLDGDMAIFQQLVQFFFEDSPELREQLRVAIDTGNCEEVEHTAHRLRGLVEHFSAHTTAQAAQKIEMFAALGDLSAAQNALRDLDVQLECLSISLATYRETPQPGR